MNVLSESDDAHLLRETIGQFWQHIIPIVWLSLSIHIVFCLLFLALQIPSLIVSNLLSVMVYAFCLKAIRIGRYNIAGILISTEIILHTLLATWKLGWNSNFYFYLYCLIPIIAFSFQRAAIPRFLLNFAIIIVSVGGFALRGEMGTNTDVKPQIIEVLGIMNVLTALAVLLHCTKLSVGFTHSLQSQLFHTAHHDSLTNLYTRRRVMQEVKQLSESSSSAIILLDIDHFKQINDKLGHKFGDVILKRIAIAINSHVRITDLASRWGGEEFLVLMPDTSVDDAQDVADKILLHIRDWVGQIANEPLTVTATLSVSEIRAGESFENAFNRTDNALYDGKKQGRNQVVIAS